MVKERICGIMKNENTSTLINTAIVGDTVKKVDHAKRWVSIILELLQKNNWAPTVVNVSYFLGDKAYQPEYFKRMATEVHEDEIMLATPSATAKYLSPDKYYLGEPVEGKKPLPVKALLAVEDLRMEEAGFVSVTKYTDYVYTGCYVYNNEAGKKLICLLQEEHDAVA